MRTAYAIVVLLAVPWVVAAPAHGAWQESPLAGSASAWLGPAVDALPSLRAPGSALRRGLLGVQLEGVADGACVIRRILPNTSAERIGLQAGDVILRLDGKPVAGVAELIRVVSFTPPEGLVTILVRRDAKRVVKPLLVGDRTAGPIEERRFDLLGLWFDCEREGGLRIDRVEAGSPAESAGLVRGMIVRRVNGRTVGSPAALAAELYVYPASVHARPVALGVDWRGMTLLVDVNRWR